jgi:hypothetical protein
MILVLGHVARVHPTANSPLCRLQVRIRGAHPTSVLLVIRPELKEMDET